MTTIGTTVLYCDEEWTVSAVGWVGERYYWLTRENEVAMLPAFMVEELPRASASTTQIDRKAKVTK